MGLVDFLSEIVVSKEKRIENELRHRKRLNRRLALENELAAEEAKTDDLERQLRHRQRKTESS
jgi:hypothetical protein